MRGGGRGWRRRYSATHNPPPHYPARLHTTLLPYPFIMLWRARGTLAVEVARPHPARVPSPLVPLSPSAPTSPISPSSSPTAFPSCSPLSHPSHWIPISSSLSSSLSQLSPTPSSSTPHSLISSRPDPHLLNPSSHPHPPHKLISPIPLPHHRIQPP